jgi:iron(III) transport system ATP-binding protein
MKIVREKRMYKVTVKNIFKSFGKTAVLREVDLVIEPGELFFLLGPSGCGKTTLLRIITGFENPDKGQVFFDDRDVTNLPPQKRNTSMVFQNYALWPHLTVRQNIAFGLENRHVPTGEMETRIKDVLKLVRMEEYENRLPNQLSGGQQQRIALARALVVNPQLVLLDEPLSNLDARLRAEMRIELLRLHRATGITTIYVTHDQEEALSMADRIGFMDEGRLIQVGTARELFNYPKNIKTGRFLGNANLVKGTVKSISKESIEVETPLGVLMAKTVSGTTPDKNALVHCFFRPDAMVQGSTALNCINGKVVSSLYSGSREHLYLEYNGIQFQALAVSGDRPAIAGSEMSFTIAPEQIRILEE